MLASATLNMTDYAAIAGILIGGMSPFVAAVLWLIKAMTRRLEIIESRVQRIEERKTDKYDWIRGEVTIRKKIDQLSSQLARMDGKLDGNFGIAASINRLADEVKIARRDAGDMKAEAP